MKTVVFNAKVENRCVKNDYAYCSIPNGFDVESGFGGGVSWACSGDGQ